MKTRHLLAVLFTVVGLLLGPISQQAKAVTYQPISCSYGYYADSWNAYAYLDMWAAPNDYGLCVPSSIFSARNGYLPVWGTEANVENDYGKVVIKQNGNCSPPALPTGLYWDFELPCKAHDYCYDLRKAGFSGTVSDSDCDGAFFYLMEAHCNDRFFASGCRDIRDIYYLAVSLPGVVTNPDPAAVTIQALHSGQCADVPASSTSFNAPITQYSCFYTSNQKFKFMPASGSPGYFEIRPSHVPSLCVEDGSGNLLRQANCGIPSSQFRIQGSYNQNNYTFRSKLYNNARCWDVPYSSTSFGIQLMEYYCNETSNQRFNLG